MTEKEAAKPLKVLRKADLTAKVGLSIPTIDRMVAAGKFPAPFDLTDSALGWFEYEIDDWLRERAASSRFEE